MLQSSGRTNLVNLRDTNAGIFGTILSQTEPSSSSSLPLSFTNPLPSQPQNQGPLMVAETQMPPLSFPNELSLSQALPTAEDLALEDLFDHGNASVSLATANPLLQSSLVTQAATLLSLPTTNTTANTSADSAQQSFQPLGPYEQQHLDMLMTTPGRGPTAAEAGQGPPHMGMGFDQGEGKDQDAGDNERQPAGPNERREVPH